MKEHPLICSEHEVRCLLAGEALYRVVPGARVGDTAWVRERFASVKTRDGWQWPRTYYAASTPATVNARWFPNYQLPRALCRLVLTLTADGWRIPARRGPWTPAEDAQLVGRRLRATNQELAAELGRSERSVLARLSRLKLAGGRRRPNAGSFRPGAVPHNKGQVGWNPPGSEKGHFRPGQPPPTAKPDGSERLSKEGYRERKVAGRWRPVQRLIWEAAHGPVPPAHVVVFRDGDKTNLALANLECISRAQLSARNSPATRQTDDYVARQMSGGKHYDPALRDALLEQPELLTLQRAANQLRRLLK